MFKFQAHFFLLVLSIVSAKEEELNEINPVKQPPINLDTNLRRALLKALTELENEENAKSKEPSPLRINLPHLDTSDKIVEKAAASALSYFTSTGSSTSTENPQVTATEETTPSQVYIIQRSRGVQHKPITTIEHLNVDSEQILTSASSSFTSSSKFTNSKNDGQARNVGSDKNSLSKQGKPVTKRPKIETTTVITTTTSTEESEAKVEDVQFFSAPLVAAFTVHQDESGVPRSVEPIYKPVQKIEAKTTTKQPKFLPTQEPSTEKPTSLPSHQQEQIKNQYLLQEKQRLLEEEILRLKQQQLHQNYLIRQQQILHEQQLQLQKQKLLEEQKRIQSNQQQFVPLVNSNQFNNQQSNQLRSEFNNNSARNNHLTPLASSNFVNQFNNQQSSQTRNEQNNNRNNQFSSSVPLVVNPKFINNQQQQQQQQTQLSTGFNNNSRLKGSLVSFQPSITFSNPQFGQLPLNGQILPVKDAGDFRSPVITQDFRPFKYVAQQQPPLPTTLPNFNQNFNSIPQPAITLLAPKHNRVFRQESDTGNFGTSSSNNENVNFFNTNLRQQLPNNRFFRSNQESTFTSNFNRIEPPAVNQQLNSLLFNSGIIRGNRQQEDLNIVSKVLSLNHVGGDYRYASSNVNEQRLPAPLGKV